MSKNRYNTVLFVAALSVSMGLFLMSAPPHVFAEAALTGKFEIKDQAEKKDNLDKDDKEIKDLADFYGDYLQDVQDFIEDLHKLHQIEKFDTSTNNKFKTHKVQNYQLKLGFEKSLLKIEISGRKDSPQKAKQFFDNLNSAIKLHTLDEKIVAKVIHENTTVSSANNQIFIVTRLPRGSLVEILTGEKSAK